MTHRTNPLSFRLPGTAPLQRTPVFALLSPARRKTILLLSTYEMLRVTRSCILRRAGYSVFSTKHESLAVTLASQQLFDAVLLCSSVNAVSAMRVAFAVHERGKGASVIRFGLEDSWFADRSIPTAASPDEWIAMVAQALSEKAAAQGTAVPAPRSISDGKAEAYLPQSESLRTRS